MANPSTTTSEPIGVKLNPAQVKVIPGGPPEMIMAEVRNAGKIVDQYRIEIESLDASWYTVIMSSVALLPGSSAQIPIRIQVPKDAKARAGTYPFAVRANSQANAMVSGVGRGVLEVTPFVDLKTEISPRRATGRKGNFKLNINNRGNDDVQLELSGKDADATLNYDFKDSTPKINANDDMNVPLVVKASNFHFVGKPNRYVFEVVGVPVGGQKEAGQAVTGEFVHRAIFPNWIVLILLLLFLALAIFLCGGFWQSVPVVRNIFNPPPTPLPTATPTATPRPLAILDFDSDQNMVDAGQSVTLAWRLAGVTNDTIVLVAKKPITELNEKRAGTLTVRVTRPTKYKIEIWNPDQEEDTYKTGDVQVLVTQPPPVVNVVVPQQPLNEAPAAASSGGQKPPASGGGGQQQQPPSGGGGQQQQPPASGGGGQQQQPPSGGTSGGGQQAAPTPQPAAPTVAPSGGGQNPPANTPVPVQPTPAPGQPTAVPVQPTAAPVQPTAAPAQPTPLPVVQLPPAQPGRDPVSDVVAPLAAVNGQANPAGVSTGDTVTLIGTGLKPGENVKYTLISPNYGQASQDMKSVVGADGTIRASITMKQENGTSDPKNAGLYTVLFEGKSSHNVSIIFYTLVPPGGPFACPVPEGAQDMAMPSAIQYLQKIVFATGPGFEQGEGVSFTFTSDGGETISSGAPVSDYTRDEDGAALPWVRPDGRIVFSQQLSDPKFQQPGGWTLAFRGEKSGHTASIKFCIVRP